MTEKLTRRMLIRVASALSLGMAGASVLGACAPQAVPAPPPAENEAPTDKEPIEKEAPVQPAAKEQVVLQLHLRAGGELSEVPIYVTRPGEFMEEHPEIKVELAPIPGGEYEAKAQTMAAANTLGDVMWTAAGYAYHTRITRQGLIAAVDDHLDAYGKSKQEWIPACVETITHEGKMHGLPKCCHPSACMIWINENMFQEAGIGIPETYGNTWENLVEWCEKLAKGPEDDREVWAYFFGVNSVETLVTPMRAYGGWEANADGTESLIDSPECYEWAQYTEMMFRKGLTLHEGGLPPEGFHGLFAAGRVAMVAGGRWMYNRIVSAVQEAGDKVQWRVIQVPRGPKANGWMARVDTHSATTQSEHPEEAFLLSYALADKRFTELVAKEIGYLGARVDDVDTIQPFVTPFLQLQYDCMLQEEAIRQPANCRGSEFQTALVNELDPIWLGDESVTPDTMKRVKAALDEVFAKPF